MAQDNSEIMPPPNQLNNDSFNWILFAFGAALLLIGIYLSHPDRINPSIGIGAIVIIAALGLIRIAFYRIVAIFLPVKINKRGNSL